MLLAVQRAADSRAAGCYWRIGPVRSVPSAGTAPRLLMVLCRRR